MCDFPRIGTHARPIGLLYKKIRESYIVMFLGGLFMIGLALRDHYLRDMAAKTRHGNELDVAIFKALGNMIWISMPESV